MFCDRLNHASLMDGCLLSGARWSRYRHLDSEHLENRLRQAPKNARKWVVTDSVFSMDGDYPDLRAMLDVAERYDAWVMVDEAHATGLYGAQRSSGLCEAFGVAERVALQMGTFGKALGGFGAYAAGSNILIQMLVNRARGFIYSTALPPATIAAADCAVQLVQTDCSMKARLWENIRLFERFMPGLKPIQSPIIPIFSAKNIMRLSRSLLEAGYFVQGIRPPTVPTGTERLRITLSAAHSPEQIAGLATLLTHSPLENS